MTDEPVLAESRGSWRLLTLNRPDKLNSFNVPMHEALIAALKAAEADRGCRAIVITGAGRAFSAGQDLGDRVRGNGAEPPDLGATLEAYYNPLVRTLRTLPFPVIAAVNGVAAGAACNMALACDIVLAARSARFLEPFARLGLIPDAGGTWALPRLIGPARARAMAMLADPVDAETAERWGLIWRAVDDDGLIGEACALAERLASGPTEGFALMKRAFDASATNSLDEQLDLERDLQRVAGRTPDYGEGVSAFMEKRPARFVGRGS